ncbi:MAG: ABC transporter ATP-binding protein [Oscillospiraceae bacterium]|nr:ABC transporter ATP-binding protein [Oscillospiraceae bacterium]
MALLDVKDLHISYGAIKAVRGISFTIEEGEIVTIIGTNGAGKSTIMRTLMGLERAERGTVLFQGRDVTNAPSYAIVKSGMVLSPEGRHIFPGLSVHENLKLGAYTASQTAAKQGYENAFALFPILKERLNQAAGTLSGGGQQMLDEPSLGLAPIVVQDLFRLFQRVNSQGTTILLVEQNARMPLQISHRGYVLETGQIVLTDTGERLAQNERVRDAYLGGL